MAQPNYQFAKRQKDLAKKQKQEQQRLAKLSKNAAPPDEVNPDAPAPLPGDTKVGTNDT